MRIFDTSHRLAGLRKSPRPRTNSQEDWLPHFLKSTWKILEGENVGSSRHKSRHIRRMGIINPLYHRDFQAIPSGKLTVCYWKIWTYPIEFVDLPIQNGYFFHSLFVYRRVCLNVCLNVRSPLKIMGIPLLICLPTL